MDAVRVHFDGDFHVIVDDKRDAVFPGHGLQPHSFLIKAVLIEVLFTKLKESHSAV